MAALDESGIKSLLEHLQGDFKAISGEAKRKLPAVKEVKQVLAVSLRTEPTTFKPLNDTSSRRLYTFGLPP